MNRSRGEQLVKGRYRERQTGDGEEGENGVYDCNRLGGRTARVAPAVLPIIAGAFVAPSLLSKSPSLPFSFFFSCSRFYRQPSVSDDERETRRANGCSGELGEATAAAGHDSWPIFELPLCR